MWPSGREHGVPQKRSMVQIPIVAVTSRQGTSSWPSFSEKMGIYSYWSLVCLSTNIMLCKQTGTSNNGSVMAIFYIRALISIQEVLAVNCCHCSCAIVAGNFSRVSDWVQLHPSNIPTRPYALMSWHRHVGGTSHCFVRACDLQLAHF